MTTETIDQAEARVLKDALLRYAQTTLGLDRAIAKQLALVADLIIEKWRDADL